MDVTFIGGGFISEKLRNCAPAGYDIRLISMRDLPRNNKLRINHFRKCSESSLIVFLAYDHWDVLKNIAVLKELLVSLKSANWKGRLVYFNTQAVIGNLVFKNKKFTKAFLGIEQYSITKKIQSWLLSKYSNIIDVSELYLPVVIGDGSNAEHSYMNIAKYQSVNLPSQGKNLLAYLDVDVFSKWFWSSYVNELFCAAKHGSFRKIFVYEGLHTFAEMVSVAREKINSFEESKAVVLQSYVIGNCCYKYRFADKAIQNYKFVLKVSLLWLLFNIIRARCRGLFKPRSILVEHQKQIKFLPGAFIPIGLEYQYLSSSIDLSLIPFKILKI
jgi:hypothetical protein